MAIAVILVKAPVTISDILPYAFVAIIYATIGQIIFAFWKKYHQESYNIYILCSIIAVLPAISIVFANYFLLAVYIAFISLIGYFVFIAWNFTSNKNAPKIVFNGFKNIFTVTNHCALFFQIALIILFITKNPEYMLLCLKMMGYSIYFAVLSREIVKNLCLVMARKTGYYSKEGIPGKMISNDTCIVCTNTFSNEDKIVTLKCGHLYHEDCLKGWTIIGQNNFCYYCKEGIDSKVFPTQDYWLRTEVFIRPVMNTMRSFISFLLFAALIFIMKASLQTDMNINY